MMHCAQRVANEGWCPGRESNPHAPFGARDFKSRASASFATRAAAAIVAAGTGAAAAFMIHENGAIAVCGRALSLRSQANVQVVLIGANPYSRRIPCIASCPAGILLEPPSGHRKMLQIKQIQTL